MSLESIAREGAQLEIAVDEVQKVLDPIFNRGDAGYILVAFRKAPGPGFAKYASNVGLDRLTEVLIEIAMRLKSQEEDTETKV